MAEGRVPAGPAASGRPGGLVILDYGMGNLRSVEKAFERVGHPARITADDAAIAAAGGLVLPGVGAFPRAMQRIRAQGWPELIRDRVEAGVPLLGICLGYQLLFERSEEFGGDTGLGLLEGEVRTLAAPGLKVPHIGWEPVSWEHDSPLTAGLPDGTAFYFVHSLAPHPRPADRLGSAEFGDRFAAAAAQQRVYGVQFHPEKSGAAGLALLANFGQICVDPNRPVGGE